MIRPIWILPALLLVLSLASCNTYNFSGPQPVDAKNLYEFPSGMRGTFVDGSDSTVIAKTFAIKYKRTIKRIFNGAWEHHPNDSIHQKEFKADANVREITFDSSGKPVDTLVNYLVIGNKIYGKDHDKLSSGFPYEVRNDTIYFTSVEYQAFHLGPGTFLREVKPNLFMFNIRNELILGPEELPGWWQLVLFETGDKKLKIRMFSSDIEKDPSLVKQLGTNYYFEPRWTKEDINKLILRGAFEDGDPALTLKKEKR